MYNVGLAYFLWLISGFGALGFHRFYLGKNLSGALWMFTGGLAMFGSIYDFFTLPNQVREANVRRAIQSGREYDTVSGASDAGWQNVSDWESHTARKKESIERIILRKAKETKGILTASEVALAADVPIDEAKKCLDALVSKGFAELRVRKSGSLVYTIPDILDKNEPLEDF